jgi:hypothetical protein
MRDAFCALWPTSVPRLPSPQLLIFKYLVVFKKNSQTGMAFALYALSLE